MSLRRPVAVAFLALALVAVEAPLPAHAAPRYRRAIDITFPTVASARYRNDYMGARSAHLHRATDLFTRAGARVIAARGGRVVWLPRGEHPTAGFAIWIRDAAGRTYAYYHLGDAGGRRRSAIVRHLDVGDRVRRGQHIGWVGDSGNAAGGTPHLHFEIHDPSVTDPFGGNRRNPYASLRRAQDGRVPSRPGGRASRAQRSTRQAASPQHATLLRGGSRGAAVVRWQRQLNRATRARLAPDGVFGPLTRAATVRFQRSAGLGPRGLGVVGPKTRRAMARRLDAAAPTVATRSSPPVLRYGSRGAAVRRWQRRLNRAASAGLATDGVFGPMTRAATVRFQRSAGLGPSGLGIVGPRTRRAMARRLP